MIAQSPLISVAPTVVMLEWLQEKIVQIPFPWPLGNWFGRGLFCQGALPAKPPQIGPQTTARPATPLLWLCWGQLTLYNLAEVPTQFKSTLSFFFSFFLSLAPASYILTYSIHLLTDVVNGSLPIRNTHIQASSLMATCRLDISGAVTAPHGGREAWKGFISLESLGFCLFLLKVGKVI